MNAPIFVGSVIWIGASITARIMDTRAYRLLTSEQQAEVESVSWEMYLFARFLRFDLYVVFIVILLMWSGTTVAVTFAFISALMGAIILGHIIAARRVQRLGLPSQYVKAYQRTLAVRCAGPCVMVLLFAYASLRQP